MTTRGLGRLGRLAASSCTNVIVDTSRNGTQRYCSPRCASRDAVRPHRTRVRPTDALTVSLIEQFRPANRRLGWWQKGGEVRGRHAHPVDRA
ncbi:MAG TPA: CGNR zinc finger domain-containing protein [Propionibacteriaceae bacterium]